VISAHRHVRTTVTAATNVCVANGTAGPVARLWFPSLTTLFGSLCGSIRLGADGALEAMLGHFVGNDLTPELFESPLDVAGFSRHVPLGLLGHTREMRLRPEIMRDRLGR
jgi:hypothetical protein